MNMKQIHYFLVVASEHQITSAAKLLYMEQPPLSYQIKQLEKELGTKLFIRKPHGLELTTAGESFRHYAEQIERLNLQAKEELKRTNDGTMGSLKIGIISSASPQLNNPSIHQFTHYYPNVSFQITEANTFKLLKQLKNGLLDLAILRTPFNQQGLNTKVLASDQMTAVFHPRFYSLNESIQLKDLSQVPLIIYRRFESLFNDSFAHHGMRPFYAVKCDDARTAIHWADEGMGVAIVPKRVASLYSRQSVRIINYPAWQTKLVLAWPRNKNESPLQRRFIDAFSA